MKNFIEELRQRGMIQDHTPEVEQQLNSQMTVGYIGFDPTAASLHIGNLATIMLLVHFQRCGHKPIALIGGATGMIGDPSGKSSERNLLSYETILHNQARIRKQLEHFLDFDCGANSAEIVNNYDWMKNFSFLEFLRDVGKHLTVNYMLAKDSVQKRLESGISYTEFSYQLLQAYDFYYLYTNKNVKLQMGGSDQWGNITSGIELIRRISGKTAYALTTPLVTKSDGTKFGKSESGNVWLDAEMTSPYQFYQFWLNVSDEDTHKLIRVFTLFSIEEIQSLEQQHAQAPHQRILQKAIAEQVTERVHGKAELQKAKTASEILFGKGVTDALKSLDEKTFLQALEGVPQTHISASEFYNCHNLAELLCTATRNEIFPSKSEVRKMVQNGGISINKQKVESTEIKPTAFDLIHNRYLLVQKGKKNYHLVVVKD
ncbi:MAG: tyrosine--tRNA ligase [Cytophagales bacterium]|nr:tyrosine--tRNA ligase [Cytophagales bacterium]MDW8384014.1 tyrosine--tRNA ligase [Flammeovirgaceae bacterium]